MRIYLDNNATTPLDAEVLAAFDQALRDLFGNASSIHKEGQSARRSIEEAREAVARLAGATPREVVFTSGGTESNNAAILGIAPAESRFHIVTTTIEHPSVLGPVQEMERRGCAVTLVAPGRSGVVDAAAVIDAVTPETKLVSVMLANNETGVIQPVAQIGRACRDRGVHFHVDAVQAAGKIAISFAEIGCDTMALSAHKLHAPKGIGALVVRQGVTLSPLLFGGAQERRRRSGTENAPAAVAFGVACERALASTADVAALRDRFETRLREEFGDEVTINGATAPRLPNTASVTFRRADAEGLVIALDLAGIAVSTGSACSSGRIEPSHVLLAMGLDAEEARGTIRFSFSRMNTPADIDETVVALKERVPLVRSS